MINALFLHSKYTQKIMGQGKAYLPAPTHSDGYFENVWFS